MAKKKAVKKAAKKAAPTKATKKAKKATKRGSAKKAAHEEEFLHEEITLDPVEDKAVDLVEESDKVRNQLEEEVTAAAIKVVRKVFQDNGIALTQAQAEHLTDVFFA